MMLSLLLAVTLEFLPADAHIAYTTAKTLVDDCTPREAGTIRGRIAANRLLDLASIRGADVRRDIFKVQTPKGERELTNLCAEYSNADPTNSWIVLISHYDTKPGVACPGANDGASTSGLLVGLANALARWSEPKGNLLMIWSDGEECMSAYDGHDGLWGSRRAVEYIRQRGIKVRAAICLDMLGDEDLQIGIPANGTPTLAKIALHAAARAGSAGLVSMMQEHVKDDHVAFLDAKISAIDLIDFSYGPNNAYWHTEQDTMAHVSEESLLTSGKLVVELLKILL